jgi:ribosomal protein S12 methylthiotransferase accessory factor YcaO
MLRLRCAGDPLAAHQFAVGTPAAGTAAAAAGASAAAAAAPGNAAAPAPAAAQPAGPGDAVTGEAYLKQSGPDADAQAERRRLRALLRSHFPRHPRRVGTLEYCQLPAAVKAAVAARLTSDVLQVALTCRRASCMCLLQCITTCPPCTAPDFQHVPLSVLPYESMEAGPDPEHVV